MYLDHIFTLTKSLGNTLYILTKHIVIRSLEIQFDLPAGAHHTGAASRLHAYGTVFHICGLFHPLVNDFIRTLGTFIFQINRQAHCISGAYADTAASIGQQVVICIFIC